MRLIANLIIISASIVQIVIAMMITRQSKRTIETSKRTIEILERLKKRRESQ